MDNQEVELHGDENSIVDEATHDMKNAEEQSIASVASAAKSVGRAKKRKGDKEGGDKTAYKTVAGTPEKASESFDFEDGLDSLIEEEATLSDEFKVKSAIIFETALKSKLSEELDRLEEQYATQLDEEVNNIHNELVEKVDNYLNYVVENWMKENELAIQQGLRTEIAEDFMNGLKGLFEESYIDVPESKVDLVDGLSEQVDELEAKLNEQIEVMMYLSEQNELLMREAIIAEASYDLADTQADKLSSLLEDIDFEDADTFATKVQTVKESFFNRKKTTEQEEIVEDFEGSNVVESSSSMEQYLRAMRRINNQ